jgi:hypothetical protein
LRCSVLVRVLMLTLCCFLVHLQALDGAVRGLTVGDQAVIEVSEAGRQAAVEGFIEGGGAARAILRDMAATQSLGGARKCRTR